MINSAFEIRSKLISDPYRPGYHFAFPYGCDGACGDPNGAFFADGRYHMMYLYKVRMGESKWFWGHVSSADLLHWRYHPDALSPSEKEMNEADECGYFSGGAFLDDDGTAYISCWAFPKKGVHKGGIEILKSRPPYENWEAIEPLMLETSGDTWGIHETEIDGETVQLGCADPSNIWKKNGVYYIQLGNLPVLQKYGRDENSPEKYKGGWTELFRSRDLKKWEFVGRFYDKPSDLPSSPDDSEDDMCPSFLPLYNKVENGETTDRFLQLFIAHNRGCQYFVGSMDGERFVPESHGRMSWNDKTYFAPEALIDDRGRHIIFTWLFESDEIRQQSLEWFGYNGVYALPRCVWLSDGVLGISPISELDSLEYNRQSFDLSNLSSGDVIEVKNPRSCRIRAEFEVCGKCGISVLGNSDSGERLEIYFSPDDKLLVCDTNGMPTVSEKNREEAPLELHEGERLCLDIFVDKSIVEVFANNRQAICRRVLVKNPETATEIRLIGEGCTELSCSEMSPSNEL